MDATPTKTSQGAWRATGWLKRAAPAWSIATLAVGVGEWLTVIALDSVAIPGAGAKAALLLLGLGNLAPYALLGVGLVLIVESAAQLLSRKIGKVWSVALLAGAVFLLALPYAIPLGRFTFSGPAARNLAHHGLLVLGAVTLAAASFAAFSALVAAGLPGRLRRASVPLSLVLTLTCVWVSRTTLADEYEPLHAFLAVWSVAFAALLGCSAVSPDRLPAARAAWLAGGLTLVSFLGATVIAGRMPAVAWVLWSRTGTSRYITQRIKIFEPSVPRDGKSATMLLKPRLDSELSLARRRARAAQPAPHIVIFSIDGLRPDHLGAYGYKRHPTSPNIDRFAERGVRFTNAYSSYPQTAYFNSALLTGRYVGALQKRHTIPAAFQNSAITRLLQQRDYHVLVKAWFEHSSQNTFNPATYQIDTHLKKNRTKIHLEEPLEERLPYFEQHVEQARQAGKPVFMWMHLLGTHPVKGKFVPDPAFSFGRSRSQQYASAIAGSDRWLEHVEKLMGGLADPARPTIWIICSDHGVRVEEEGRDLYASIVRVPLIIVSPALKPGVRHEPVDTSLDVAATVLDLAGISPPETYDGISLLPLLEVGDPQGQMKNRLIPLKRANWRGAIYGPFKLLKYGDSQSLVNTSEDPREQTNLIGHYQGLARVMQERAEQELERRIASLQQGLQAEAEDDGDNDEE